LHPGEGSAHDSGEAAHRKGLCSTRHAFQQHVPLGQQTYHELLDHVLLAHNDPLHLGNRPSQQLGGLSGRHDLLRGRRLRHVAGCTHARLLMRLKDVAHRNVRASPALMA